MAFVLTSLSGNLISAASAGFAPTNSADVSAIASAYVSGKQDTLTFAYDDDKISAINGSALAGGGGVTGDYVEKSAMEVAIGSGNAVSATSFAFGENNSATSRSFALGSYCAASASSIALGSGSRASSNSISVGYSGYSNNRSLSVGNRASANMDSMAAGEYSTASDNSLAVGNHAVASLESIAVGTYCRSLCGYARGQNNSGYFAFMDGTSLRAKSATAFGTCNLSGNNDSAVFVIGDGTDSATGRHDLMTISRDGEITMYSSTADTTGTGIMSSIRAISAAATGGGVDSATVSAIASSYAESAASSKLDTTAFSNVSGTFLTAHQDLSDYQTVAGMTAYQPIGNYLTANALDEVSSTWDTVTAKLDTTAFNSGDFYSTANPSGFLTGVDMSPYQTTADMSGYIPTSLSSDFQQVTGMSSYVPYSSLEYNTANAISAINGSALAAGSTYSAGEGIDITDDVISVEAPVDIVAGPGIVIDNPDGNTLRVSMASDYEVELYYSPQNHNVANDAEFAMSESIWNFSKVLITFDNMEFENRTLTMLIDLAVADTGTKFCTPYCNGDTPGTINIVWAAFSINAAGNIKYSNRGLIYGTWTSPAFTTGTSRGYRVKRVVGIHRINGGN